jgi:hypothetical protein
MTELEGLLLAKVRQVVRQGYGEVRIKVHDHLIAQVETVVREHPLTAPTKEGTLPVR